MQQIYLNLPVTELARAERFYLALGFRKEPKFSNEKATAIQVSETIFVMLLTHEFFKGFTPCAIADAKKVSQTLLCLPFESRVRVDQMMALGLSGGGTEAMPTVDHGFMVQRTLADPDGHIWELVWMDERAFEAQKS